MKSKQRRFDDHRPLGRFRFAVAVIASFVSAAPALAQTTGAVIGPKVKAGDRSFEYRAAYAPADGRDGFNQRLHFQYAVNDRLRLRIIGVQNNSGEDLRFRSVQLESHYQFIKDTNGWNSAIQVQGQIPDGNDGPGRMRIAWTTSMEPAEGWEVRAVILAAREIGDQARDGIILETRGEATYAIAIGYRLGAQFFNNYNSTANFGSFNNQRHSVGPVLKGKLGKRVGYNLSALFGVSERAPDANLRLFLSYAL